jgi:hypothetical protein
MAKRGVPTKQITVEVPIMERFLSYGEYGMNKEGILIMLMDEADEYRKRKGQPRNHGKFTSIKEEE